MISKLAFGRTGHLSTRIIYGGWALADVSPSDAAQALDTLLEYGINHIDTAASYGDSELHIGPWMVNHRKDFFLATKTAERTYQGAKEELHRSLERLQTDSVDLWQMHLLVKEEEWQTAMGPGGALEAFIEAREQGLVRYLGVTGHGMQVPDYHIRSLERFDFDSVLLPYNPFLMSDSAYAASFNSLEATCQAKEVAIQTIKSLAIRLWREGETHKFHTWYKPFEDQDKIDMLVHWVLSHPGVFLNSSGNIQLLPKILEAAVRFDEAMQQSDFEADLAQLPFETIFPS